MRSAPVVVTEAESASLITEELALSAAREAFLATTTGTTFPVVIGHAAEPANRFTLKSGSAQLGAVLAGHAPGRRSPDDITVFDSSGFALQDLTLATALLRRSADLKEHR